MNFTLDARKEAIISAGAFQSPQLLMVSGIGNETELAEHNISCKIDLPGVGQGMWDHPIFGSSHAVNVNTASAALNNATLAQQLVQTYLSTAGGPLSIFGPGYYGWEKVPEPYRSKLSASTRAALDRDFPSDWPEIEWLPVASYLGYARDRQTEDPRDGQSYATLNNALITPYSRGTVKLASPYMWDLPIVDPAWLTHPSDREVAVQAFRRQREIWSVLVDLGLAHPTEVFPGPSVQTDAEVLQWIGESMTTVYHAAATCKMGRKSDRMAVVDASARVFGTERLRIVDASAVPFLPPGHPQSTVYAFAEKIADQVVKGKRM